MKLLSRAVARLLEWLRTLRRYRRYDRLGQEYHSHGDEGPPIYRTS
ncbi:MAG TPA: hypothetical protein VNI61_05745 [Gemmatimonadales bacterium]|nr:hypothetical protein [Gemmatimonadales bacterium]